jgi:hypothetical protein
LLPIAAIAAYCSHSYRAIDRAINIAIWEQLNAAGMVFNVDPSSHGERPMDVTFAERMMRRSQCFVAVVPDRSFDIDVSDDESTLTWSRYQELEYRIAVRFNKPRLILIEENIDDGPLRGEPYLWFKRDTLTLSPAFDRDVPILIDYVRSRERLEGRARNRDGGPSTIPQVGLLRWYPTDQAWNRFTDHIKRLLRERSGVNCTYIDVDETKHDHEVLAEARETSLIVADMNPAITPPSLIGLLQGAGIPLYRTCLVGEKEDPELWWRRLGLATGSTLSTYASAADNALTHLLAGYQLDERMRPVLFWTAKGMSQDASTIATQIGEYRHRERRLKEQHSGRVYFLSQHGHRVFISTPGDISEFTKHVKCALDDAGMPAFHYKSSAMKSVHWKPQLEEHIQSSDIFLAFLTPSYWDRDECLDEMAMAIEHWERHEILLMLCADDAPPALPPFLQTLQRLQINRTDPPRETSAKIVSELRDRLNDRARESPKSSTALLVELVSRHVTLSDKRKFTEWFMRHAISKSPRDRSSLTACLRSKSRGAPER